MIFWEMPILFSAISPQIKVTTFYFVGSLTVIIRWPTIKTYHITLRHLSSQPSKMVGDYFGLRQNIIWGMAFPDCTFSTLILDVPERRKTAMKIGGRGQITVFG
jgi:hypothetical protein